jgi:hypothetical protein
VEEDVEVIYLKRVSFTAASSNEETVTLDYDTDDAEFHYRFTAFGRCKFIQMNCFRATRNIYHLEARLFCFEFIWCFRRPVKEQSLDS